ncbi:MAG: response regulator [Victivallaceae bacterium]
MSEIKTLPNVLVCDDDSVFLSFFKRVLKMNGFNAFTALNGDEAVDILQSDNEIVLAVIDLLMPIRSGWEVIEFMKNRSELENIPIIAITGLSPAPGDLQKVETMCDAVVHKGADFNVEEFSALVKKLT